MSTMAVVIMDMIITVLGRIFLQDKCHAANVDGYNTHSNDGSGDDSNSYDADGDDSNSDNGNSDDGDRWWAQWRSY